MNIVVTGARGFIASNLRVRLAEAGYTDVVQVTRESSDDDVRNALERADFVFHLAGANRPVDPADFGRTNADFTARLCDHLLSLGGRTPIVYTSSTQATLDNPYGQSKRAGEDVLERYAAASGAGVAILRLTNVFGKWCRPNYNSAVATFCHNIARGLPITVNDPAAPLHLVYVDDVVDAMLGLLHAPPSGCTRPEVGPVYATTVGEVASAIQAFAESRATRTIPRVGVGLMRALYATYVSYLAPEAFAYDLTAHRDPRGSFAEMLKTEDSGQFSFFTAGPGITRGEHYHHTKTEKFLVVRGTARFGFRHILSGECREIITDGQSPRVVETVPGWVHNITNAGDDEMIVLLWANERFDPAKPDTIPAKVAP